MRLGIDQKIYSSGFIYLKLTSYLILRYLLNILRLAVLLAYSSMSITASIWSASYKLWAV